MPARSTRPVLPLAFLAAAVLASGPAPAATLFVDADVAPGGDGSSWEDAFTDLHDALDGARTDPTVDQIWVADGTYVPHASDRDVAFELVARVTVLGGFAGGEGSADDRDPIANEAILSGDLQGNDGPDFANRGDNSRHVVVAEDADGAVLDGFTVRAGNFDLPGSLLLGGGGMLVSGTTAGQPAPHVTIRGCRFEDCSAGETFLELGNFGGALLFRGTSGTITDCVFEANRATNGGALGIFDRALDGQHLPVAFTIERTEFLRNVSPQQTGGAIWSLAGRAVTGTHEGSITVRHCRFEENHGEYYGAWNDQNTTFLLVEDTDFVRNSSIVLGGAMAHAQTGGPDADPAVFRRCTFVDNLCTEGPGGGLRLGAADGIVEASTFLGNEATVGGAIRASTQFTENGAQDLTVINSLLQGNVGVNVGGIFGDDNPIFRIVNTTIIDNVSTGFRTGGIITRADVVDIDNTILHGNVGSLGGGTQIAQLDLAPAGAVAVDFSLIEGLTGSLGGVGNLDQDPSFVDRLGPDGTAGTGDEVLVPDDGSPLIDAGRNAAVPVGIVTDLAGDARFQDDPGTPDTGEGTAPLVDIGAFEFGGVTVGVDVVAVRPPSLLRAAPNPFRSGTTIVLAGDLATSGSGVAPRSFDVLDALGRRVTTLRPTDATSRTLRWDGRDGRGRAVPPGVYWIRADPPSGTDAPAPGLRVVRVR